MRLKWLISTARFFPARKYLSLCIPLPLPQQAMGEKKRKHAQENGDHPRKRISIDAPGPASEIPPVVKVTVISENDEWPPIVGMQSASLNYQLAPAVSYC